MNKFNNLVPPGMNIANEIKLGIALLSTELIISFGFLFKYFICLNSLFRFAGGEKYIIENAKMPVFSELMYGKMFGFTILAMGCIAMVIIHYLSFYRESKSVYVMKRLENKYELFIRCITVPVIILVLGLLVFALVTALYLLVYYKVTPAKCIIPDQNIFDFWRWII